MSYNNRKTIGILGGMGAEASADLYKKIISYCQSKYEAKEDSDYPPIILYNLPANGFCSLGIRDKEVARVELCESIKLLENAGADFIVIPCNTAHYFFNDLQKAVRIPVISLIDVTLQAARKRGFQKVALLSSISTRDLGIYNRNRADSPEVVTVNDDIQSKISYLIGKVMAGKQTAKDKRDFAATIDSLFADGADAVILGCTELPLLLNQKKKNNAILDTLDILASVAVNYSITDSYFSG